MTEEQPLAGASAPLWERDAEIAAITEALDVLCADRSTSGNLLVLRGEAGLGKTALLAETRRIAERRGCTVWSTRGGETLRSVPFNVVRQLLQPALVSLMPEETARPTRRASATASSPPSAGSPDATGRWCC
jgi:hypothetical protein